MLAGYVVPPVEFIAEDDAVGLGWGRPSYTYTAMGLDGEAGPAEAVRDSFSRRALDLCTLDAVIDGAHFHLQENITCMCTNMSQVK